MTTETKKFVRTPTKGVDASPMVLEFITGYYENWVKFGKNYGEKEPCITVGLVAGYIGQSSLASESPFLSGNKYFTKWTYAVAQKALTKLKNAGKIQSSLGAGLRGGEVKCYEPAN